MIFWIYNDEGAGAVHSRTGGKALQMEVQVQAFGYQTDDELKKLTNTLFAQVMSSEDTKEGLTAFIEKRPPVWQGR